MKSFRQFLAEEDGTEEIATGVERITQGLRSTIQTTRTSWKTDSEVLTREHSRQLKRLTPEQQRKILQIINMYLVDFLRNLRARPSIASRLEDRIRTSQEMIVVRIALQNLSAAIESINSEFLHRAADLGVLQRQEVTQMINSVRQGAGFSIGPNVMAFVSQHESIFTSALKLGDDVSINVDQAAELLDRNLRAMQNQPVERKKEAVMGVHHALWALRLGIGAASVEASQFAQNRPLA